MTQTLTTEQVQEIYEAAVHVEATLGDPDAEFDLYCKLDDVGGVEATIRKLIDMLRAANRDAQPVICVDMDSDFIKHIQKCSEEVEKWPEWKRQGADVTKFTTPPSPKMRGQPVSGGYKLPPHAYRELVNSLRDTAVKYSGTDQLRERLNTALSQFIEPDHPHTRTTEPDRN